MFQDVFTNTAPELICGPLVLSRLYRKRVLHVLWVPEHRLHKTKGRKNNNTNLKQDQKYNTSQPSEESEYRYTQNDPRGVTHGPS